VRQYAWLFRDIKNRLVEDIVILSGDHLYRMDYMKVRGWLARPCRSRGTALGMLPGMPCSRGGGGRHCCGSMWCLLQRQTFSWLNCTSDPSPVCSLSSTTARRALTSPSAACLWTTHAHPTLA
jgi:hypothetical protein